MSAKSEGLAAYAAKPKCYESHPVMKIGNGKLLGASCLYPFPGYDFYVGFDHGMYFTPPHPPWKNQINKGNGRPIEALFKITDMSVPEDVVEFKNMIAWLNERLNVGDSGHIGCIGGHGRTGLVIAALMAVRGVEDPIKWTRDNHCTKAVETKSQVDFLVKHFGAKPAKVHYGEAPATKPLKFEDDHDTTFSPMQTDANHHIVWANQGPRLSLPEQLVLFKSLREGECFEYGIPFAFAPEPLMWRCLEVVENKDGSKRLTFHIYYKDVMFASKVLTVDPEVASVEEAL